MAFNFLPGYKCSKNIIKPLVDVSIIAGFIDWTLPFWFYGPGLAINVPTSGTEILALHKLSTANGLHIRDLVIAQGNILVDYHVTFCFDTNVIFKVSWNYLVHYNNYNNNKINKKIIIIIIIIKIIIMRFIDQLTLF